MCNRVEEFEDWFGGEESKNRRLLRKRFDSSTVGTDDGGGGVYVEVDGDNLPLHRERRSSGGGGQHTREEDRGKTGTGRDKKTRYLYDFGKDRK